MIDAQRILASDIKPLSSAENTNFEPCARGWHEHDWQWGQKGPRTGFFWVATAGTREDTTSLGGDSIRDGAQRSTSRIVSNGMRYRYRTADLVAAGLLEDCQ